MPSSSGLALSNVPLLLIAPDFPGSTNVSLRIFLLLDM